MTTLIVSDLHLGCRNSQAEALAELLRTPFDRLIVNGDTVNDLNLRKLRPAHWAVIAQLREVAQKRMLVLIRGNHDGAAHANLTFGPLDVLATLLGVELHEEYPLEAAGRRYLVLHGDRFDPTLHWPAVTDTADWCYQSAQRVNRRMARWLKHRAKRMGGVLERVKRRSVDYARGLGYDGVIAGHTHFCDDEHIDGVHYLNSGCWTDRPCSYVRVERGRVVLCFWDDGRPGEFPVGACDPQAIA
jgi:UDP-2,3-diacylglucosamine pyrophosphatase LpxH